MNYSSEKLTNLLAPFDVVSLIGMSKNAGKTTVLNSLCAVYAKRNTVLGLTSIGRDGEDTDILTATEKPRIFVTRGTMIATATSLLQKSDITKEIMRTTGINTAMGEVVFVRALSDGYVQIGGGAINSQIARICREFKELGVQKVLIDGAFNRRSVASPDVTGAVILSSGASLHRDMAQVVRETAFATTLLCIKPLCNAHLEKFIDILPQTIDKIIAIGMDYTYWPLDVTEPSLAANEIAFIIIRGAVTDGIITNLVSRNSNLRNCKIIIEDSSKLLIKEGTLDKLRIRGLELVVRKPITLVALTVNPVSAYGYCFDKNLFIKALQECVSIPVFNLLMDSQN